MLRKIDRRVVRVDSLESAVRYYRDVLKLKLLRQERALASFLLGDGGTELVLHSNPDAPFDEVYYLVDDVRAMYQRRVELKLKFSAPPSAVARGYRATVKDPFGNVLLLVDRAIDASAHGDVVEDGRAPGTLFSGVEERVSPRRDALIAAYLQLQRTADDLPYTPHFETLHQVYCSAFSGVKPTKQETWRHLLNLRKGGKLPKLGEAKSHPPEIDDAARQSLVGLLGKDIGKRDRLPYTSRFDAIAEAFNSTLPRPVAPHLIWRLIATLAK